ncbi:hypothetical protein FACS1894214_1000 [Planctomycetales bacterium]|nr:hypothetical protein FACS1894214_1000 [Planctomycetales bacterium]
MPNDLQHITPGNIIRADLLNTLIDGVQIARNLEHTGGTKLKTGDYSNTLIRVQNNTGQTLQQYSIVSVAEPLFSDGDSDDFQSAPAFVAEMPSSDREVFAVLQKPAAVDEIVPACISGASVVKIEVSGENHKYAKSSGDVAKLQSSETGYARILWKQDGTGEVWGIVLFPAGGGGTSAALYAVVMENIQCPADTTKTPDDEDFYSKLGRVKILGKEYENTGTEDEPEYDYDYCACLELAGKDDDYPEQILKGTQVKIVKAGQFDNPDYVAPDPEADPPVEGTPDEPEKLDWYTAVETGGYYTAAIDAGIASGETGTFTIRENQFSVHGNLIPEGFTAETGTTYRIERSVFNGGVLQLVGGECPQKEAT